MTDREAMTLALDALLIWEEMHPRTTASAVRSPAIQALRQALEWPDPFSRLVRIMGTFDLSTGHADNWNDLLDSLESELRDVLGYYREAFKVEQECSTHPDAPHGFNRDASHNYGRYVCDCEGWEPEPVAWLDVDEYEAYSNSELDEEAKKDLTPLYTAPPVREWVGLTDEEIEYLDMETSGTVHDFVHAIEAKLKEKNHA